VTYASTAKDFTASKFLSSISEQIFYTIKIFEYVSEGTEFGVLNSNFVQLSGVGHQLLVQ
jgi:hypothetical protein